MKWVAVGVAAGHLSAFLLTSGWLIAGGSVLSHHWLFPVHEALIAGTLPALGRRAPGRTLSVLSALLLLICAVRVETVYLANHTIHAAMAWAIGSILHRGLSVACAGAWRTGNRILTGVAAIWAVLTGIVALSGRIWWGIG